jgi:hypothetical protein
MAIEYISDMELDQKLGANRAVVVLYSFEQENDLKMSRILGRIQAERSDDVRFFAIKLDDEQKRAQRHGITVAPVVRVFVGGKPVAQTAGIQAREAISRQIDAVVNRPVEELTILSIKECEVRVTKGEWMNAVTSGLLAGVVFSVAIHYLQGVFVFMVPAIALGFFILNDNFRFSWEQKALAIGLMLVVGLFGGDFLRWAYAK